MTEPVRLSFSTLDLIHSCERLFQLEKLLANGSRDDTEHTVFGTAFGVGVASYLQNQDRDRALFEAWLAYYPVEESDKKDQWRCQIALMRSFDALDSLLEEYELVYFEDKPACELSFRLNIDEDFYYVGYIDAVLQHRITGKYMVFEVKHTGLLLNDLKPLYKHSGQALGYSIVLDKIVGKELSSYGVLYFVAQLQKDYNEVKPIVLPFNKTLLDRLNWFIVLGLDVQHLHSMKGLGIYPRRHTACLRFNKVCKHFGTCHLHSMDRYKEAEADLIEYQFVYSLDDVVNDHLSRIAKLPEEDLEVKEEDAEASDIIDLDSDCSFFVHPEKQAIADKSPVIQVDSSLSGKDKLNAILAAKRQALRPEH